MVDRIKMMEVLRELKIFERTFWNVRRELQNKSKKEPQPRVNKGVKQGDPMLQMLFNLIFEEVVRKTNFRDTNVMNN